MYLLVAFLSEGGARSAEVAGFSAAKAEFLFDAAFSFFWGQLRDFDCIYDHSVGVVGLGGGRVGEGMVGLMGGPGVSLGDIVGSLPLGLESNGLLVPLVDGGGDSVHRHDTVHERRWDSCGEIADQDVGVGDVCEGNVVFKHGNIFRQGRGVRVVLLLLHSLGRKPGDGVPSDIVVFERGVELRDEVSEGSKGKCRPRDGALAEGQCPGKGRSFGHVGKGEGNLLIVIVIDRLVDKEVKLHSVQPVLGFFVGAIERFGGADAQFRGFRRHRWWRWEAREEGWWWRWWWKGKKGSGVDGSR